MKITNFNSTWSWMAHRFDAGASFVCASLAKRASVVVSGTEATSP